jgi:hypothetical protein
MTIAKKRVVTERVASGEPCQTSETGNLWVNTRRREPVLAAFFVSPQPIKA